MKKAISLILTLALVLALPMAALAEEVFAAHREALQPLADQALQWLS